eukprot:TRINITY_DN20088_c0_g1_i1.p1 TRINITY_DN20088_c0_g1~~TRINITY_DN20088_c0_g1_i1.p1  ORF type:complete len:440 (+),score=122.21 TRINITY_DN20088_c0_g1_i1:89-1408(+)
MGTVFLHVGQAGIQIGKQFWDFVTAEYSTANHTFFRKGKARAILVDTEPKVAQAAQRNSTFRQENILTEQSGRGNNWAYGYFDAPGRRDDCLLDRALEAVRREVEACDFFVGCIVTHSIAGGTGSGLGSHLIESIRTAYPCQFLLSVVVTPYAAGETPLQSYNSLLSLAWLQRYVDGVILFQNERVLTALAKSLAGLTSQTVKLDAAGQYRVSVADVNLYVASCLTGVFFPMPVEASLDPKKKGKQEIKGKSAEFDIGDFVTCVCPIPDLKFIEVVTAPFVTPMKKSSRLKPWKEITASLAGSTSRYSQTEVLLNIVSQVYVRGDKDLTFMTEFAAVDKKLSKDYPSVPWNPTSRTYRRSLEPALSSNDIVKSITLCMNRNDTGFIEDILVKARLKLDASAYLHWYERYGATRELLEDSFETVQRVVDSYRQAAAPEDF